MHTVTLSDHTQDMATNAAAQRAHAYEADKQAYQAALQARAEAKRRYRAALASAWRSKAFWAILGGLWNLLFGSLPTLAPPPVARGASREEIVWATGGEGERIVAEFFERHLNDEWTLVCGYKNPKGEIDQVLVGPAGVFAIEIKYINGTVFCDGDRWWRDKYDKYDNLVETGLPIADKKGRSPSRQLNEAADQLQNFLDRHFGKGHVRRAVILSHESSREGGFSNLAVDVVSTLQGFNVWSFIGTDKALDSGAVQAVLDVIRKDHAFHTQRFATPMRPA